MRPYQHLLLSSAFSIVLWTVTRSLALSVSSFLGGILIDLDHLLDYWTEHGVRLRRHHLVEKSYHRTYRVLLHGWEWLVAGYILAYAMDWNPWVLGWTLGWTHHLVSDQLYNRPSVWGYFLLFRLRHHFAFGRVYPRQDARTPKRPQERG